MILYVLFVVAIPVFGQSNQDLNTLLIVRDLERESRVSRGTDTGPRMVGDPYYSDAWNSGTVVLYAENKSYKLTGIKYDMLNFGLDVLVNSKSKFLDGNHIKSFEYLDSITRLPHQFINGKDFVRDGVPIHGFLEILCWGKLDVFSFTEVSVTDPNYNVILNTGSENYHVNKKRTLIYGPGVDLRPVSTKELTEIWDERAEQMKKFQKINKLRLSSERDLLLMVDYFNTL